MYSNYSTNFVNYLMYSLSHHFVSIAIMVLSKLGQLFSMQWVCEFIDDLLLDFLKVESVLVMSV